MEDVLRCSSDGVIRKPGCKLDYAIQRDQRVCPSSSQNELCNG